MKTSFWQRIDLIARQVTPVILTLVLVTLTLVPYQIPDFAPVVPWLALISVYYWSVHRPDLMPAAAVFLGKLVGFSAACYGLSRLLERPFISFWRSRLEQADLTILVLGIGIMIAAAADGLGLSFAIGALFAGFVFSGDRDRVEESHAYQAMIDVFTPFFFIAIGFGLQPAVAVSALGLGLPLVLVAILGKVIGTAVPALLDTAPRMALLLGISMVPRAEIAMIVMQRGHQRGDVSDEVFGAMILVTMVTCILSPIVLQRLLGRQDSPKAAD